MIYSDKHKPMSFALEATLNMFLAALEQCATLIKGSRFGVKNLSNGRQGSKRKHVRKGVNFDYEITPIACGLL